MVSLSEREKYGFELLSYTNDGVLLLDSKGIVLDADTRNDDWTLLKGMLGMPVFAYISRQSQVLFKEAFRMTAGTGDRTEVNIMMTVTQNKLKRLTTLLMPTGEGHIYVNLTDTTDNLERDKKIENLKRYDRMTGLVNRDSFLGMLPAIDIKKNLPISLIQMDVNGMKLANDAFGFESGNELIRRVSSILRIAAPTDAVIARMGSDDFLMVVNKCDKDGAIDIADRVHELCLEEDDSLIQPSIAIGYAIKQNMRQDITSVIRTAEEQLYRNRIANRYVYRDRVIKRLMSYLSDMDFETGNHVVRVKGLALTLGEALGLSTQQLDYLAIAADIHDIGKVSTPVEILSKKEELTEDEWSIIKKHPETSYRVAISLPEMDSVGDIVLHHHERWDGKGYPYGLSGEEIPFMARIISLVDAYDNMLNSNYSGGKLAKQKAIEELKRCRGTQFDPDITDAFLKILGNY